MELPDLGFVLINAVVLACIYGTLAIGISITWSSVGLINLAYGFIYAAAGYGAWMTAQHITGNGAMVLAAGVLTGALAGLFVCALAFIPIHDKPNFPVRGMIATLAISLIGMQTLLWVFGPLSKNLPEIFGSGSVMLGDTALTADKIGNVLVSIGFVAAVVMWMRSSRRGLEIRAMMMNPHAAAIVGIGVRRTGFYLIPNNTPISRLSPHGRAPHRFFGDGDHRRDGGACRSAALADLLHLAVRGSHPDDQGRQHRALRWSRQRARRNHRGRDPRAQ